jgi:hypothetical protein
MKHGPLAVLLSAVCMSMTACGGSDPAAPLSNTTGAENSGSGGTSTSNNEPPGGSSASGGDSALPLLKLITDQVLFSGTAVTLEQIAAKPDAPGGTGFLFPRSAESPLTSFGFRPQSNNRPTATGDTQRVSILLSMVQRPGTVPAGRVAQMFQFEFDQVDIVISADHDVVKVSFPPGAQAWVYFRNATGEQVNANTAAMTQDTVTLQPIFDDTTSDYLSFNLLPAMQTIFAAAANTPKQPVLATISSMAGTFDVKITVSGVVMEDQNLIALPTISTTLGNSTLPAVTGPTMSGAIDVVAQ